MLAIDPEMSPYTPCETIENFSRRWRVWKTYSRVLFPGYVFARPGAIRRIGPCRGQLKRPDGEFATITDAEMATVREMVEAMNMENRALRFKPLHEIVTGDLVIIRGGAFDGKRARVEALLGPLGLQLQVGRHNPFKVEASALTVVKWERKKAA